MSRDELAGIARRQGLPATAALIEKFHTPELFERKFPDDESLALPAHQDAMHVVRQMARRGLHPELLRPVLKWLGDRPLERALLAWDALSGTLVPDADLLAELRAAASGFKDLLPAPGFACVDLNAHSAKSMIPGGLEKEHPVKLMALVGDFSLSAVAELERRKDALARKTAVLVSLRAIGRVLHLAHAPTLASLFFDYQSRGLDFRPAAHDLCETMFDAGASQRLPSDGVRPGDLPAELISDYAEYLTYRAYQSMVEPQQLLELIERNLHARPPKMPAPSAQLAIVRAHVSAMARRPAPFSLQAIDEICDKDKVWRYAARARVVVTAQLSAPRSPRPLVVLHDYVTGFGNDYHTAYEALFAGPADATWKQEILPMMVREARALPHELGVWRTIIMIIGDRLGVLEAVQEMRDRVEEQSRL